MLQSKSNIIKNLKISTSTQNVKFHSAGLAFQSAKVGYVDIPSNGEQQDSRIETFTQDLDRRVLLLSSTSRASGTNLQCANHVVFLEPPGTNPSDALAIETQAVGRTLRIGQERLVHVTYFVMEGTVESEIYEKLAKVRRKQERKSIG